MKPLRKLKVVLAVLPMLATSVAVVSLSASSAQASCVLGPYTQSIYIGGIKRGVEEVRSSTTCNADGVYLGRVRDTHTDGSCLSVRYYDPDFVGTMATSCDSAGYGYTFWDQDGDKYAEFRGRLTATGSLSPYYSTFAF
jgi:hypothetical protein